MDKHRGAFQYDWRVRFHLPLSVIPEEMDWAEAWNLYEILSNDPSSQVCAAQSEWDYPMSRGDAIAANTFDLVNNRLTGGKTTPYPRPYRDEKDDNANYGKRKQKTINADAREILRSRREGTNKQTKE